VDTCQREGNPLQESYPWEQAVGGKVAVEGMVWGTYHKGIGAYIILENSWVYIERTNSFERLQPDGKLVRIVGTLQLEHIEAAADYDQGYDRDFDAYIVVPDEIIFLDRVTWPWMELLEPPDSLEVRRN
jgi:hypothetical protein